MHDIEPLAARKHFPMLEVERGLSDAALARTFDASTEMESEPVGAAACAHLGSGRRKGRDVFSISVFRHFPRFGSMRAEMRGSRTV